MATHGTKKAKNTGNLRMVLNSRYRQIVQLQDILHAPPAALEYYRDKLKVEKRDAQKIEKKPNDNQALNVVPPEGSVREDHLLDMIELAIKHGLSGPVRSFLLARGRDLKMDEADVETLIRFVQDSFGQDGELAS